MVEQKRTDVGREPTPHRDQYMKRLPGESRSDLRERRLLDAPSRFGGMLERYELSGGAIMNVVRYASLMSLSRGSNTILLSDLETGAHKELQKEGRSV